MRTMASPSQELEHETRPPMTPRATRSFLDDPEFLAMAQESDGEANRRVELVCAMLIVIVLALGASVLFSIAPPAPAAPQCTSVPYEVGQHPTCADVAP